MMSGGFLPSALRANLTRSLPRENQRAAQGQVLPFGFPVECKERSGGMDNKQKTENTAEYHIGNTKYKVTPFFREASQKESIEDKIKRLILQDRMQKGAKP